MSALAAVVAGALAACMPTGEPDAPAAATGGRTPAPAAGTGGLAAHGSGGAGMGGATGDAPTEPGPTPADAGLPGEVGACIEMPLLRAGATATIDFTVEVTLAGKPLVFGEKNPLAEGGSLTPSNFRFYVSDPVLLTAERPVPVDVLGPDLRPAPYNVQLVTLDELASLRVRVAAPPGRYTGLGFTFGLNDTCNASDPARRKPPLTPTSQMTWPHPGLGLGYLFLRYEAKIEGPAGLPPVIHMGGVVHRQFAPEARALAPLEAVAGTRKSYRLRVSLDEIFKAAALPANLDDFFGPPGEEVRAGEHLRQNVDKVAIFSLAPLP